MKPVALSDEKSAATALRDQGIARSVEHADRVRAAWSELAYEVLKAYIKQRPTSMGFTTEDVRASHTIPEPPDRRAWGHVMLRAARAGLIVKVGYREHTERSRHRGISTVWEPRRVLGTP